MALLEIQAHLGKERTKKKWKSLKFIPWYWISTAYEGSKALSFPGVGRMTPRTRRRWVTATHKQQQQCTVSVTVPEREKTVQYLSKYGIRLTLRRMYPAGGEKEKAARRRSRKSRAAHSFITNPIPATHTHPSRLLANVGFSLISFFLPTAGQAFLQCTSSDGASSRWRALDLGGGGNVHAEMRRNTSKEERPFLSLVCT